MLLCVRSKPSLIKLAGHEPLQQEGTINKQSSSVLLYVLLFLHRHLSRPGVEAPPQWRSSLALNTSTAAARLFKRIPLSNLKDGNAS